MLYQQKIRLTKGIKKMKSFISFSFISNKLKAILVSCILATISTSVFAESTIEPKINNMPISIDADNQQIDIQKNIMTFSGNVVIIQDSITIKAKQVTITEIQSKDNQIITAYGQPVLFEQIIDKDGTHYKIKGSANQLIYHVKQNSVTMKGNAKIQQRDNLITSNTIRYDIQQRKIEAQSDNKQRVKTTIIPNQVKELN